MDHSSNGPPGDIDAMLQDVSNQMARSQLFRRLSANSSNSSPGSRKGNPRVIKAHSGNGSPLGVLRRRTTAAHTTRHRPQAAQPFPYSDHLPKAATRTRRHDPSPAARPMTWHPSSYALENCPEDFACDDFSAFTPYTGSQVSSYNNCSNYPPQLSTSILPPQAPQAPQATMFGYFPQSLNPGYALNYNHGDSLYQPLPNDCSGQLPYQSTADLYEIEQVASAFPTTNLSQTSAESTTHSIQHAPSVFSHENSFQTPTCPPPPQPSQPRKERSKELVGMGLYDGPGRTELSTLNSSPDHIDQLFIAPQGKGLRLEETWQPPNEDGDDADEEGSSDEENEEVLPLASAQADEQSTFIPTYGDLSNQSFFFDSDDPCVDYMPLDRGFHIYQPKAFDPALQNFMWL
ncbi:MAG: hypothetical protein Q9177_003624 [Variospora cf. flavescens]